MEGEVIPPAIYPLIGLLTGMIGGWFWQNLKPGMIGAVLIASLAGIAGGLDDRIGITGLGLGITLAALMSFFGTVAGSRLRGHFERKKK